jgi:cytochrome c peroxidase
MLFSLLLLLFVVGCRPDHPTGDIPPLPNADPYPAVTATFGDNIDLDNLFNYADQDVPAYILKDNTGANQLTDAGATLGRVLFYDKNLSVDNSVACASCHQQEFAFSDTETRSQGMNGLTGRHSMRLVNARFSDEVRFFWDERAMSLEDQTTRPIQDHAEMGFSGVNGDPGILDLIDKLEDIDYYQELFTFVYGDQQITEARLQEALSQFIRSIQSFDSKYDVGRAQANNDGAPFGNFTQQENQGKNLFLAPPVFAPGSSQRVGGGAGCAGCHRPPEFDIDPASRNNGVVGVAGSPGELDIISTRSPSLRDLVQLDGTSNGAFMHDASKSTLLDVINHYNTIIQVPGNTNLDPRLRPGGPGPGGPGGGQPQQLQLTDQEKEAMVAFLQTLSGSDIYTNAKWSNPFQ